MSIHYNSLSELTNMVAGQIITVSKTYHQLITRLKFYKTLASFVVFIVLMAANNSIVSADPSGMLRITELMASNSSTLIETAINAELTTNTADAMKAIATMSIAVDPNEIFSATGFYDGDIDGLDLAMMVAQIGRDDCTDLTPCSADLDQDGDVDEFDLQLFAIDYGHLGPLNQTPDGTIDLPGGNVSITAGQTVSFSATGTDPDGDTPLTYLWQFGAGSGVADSTLEDPGAVQFNTAGVFTVTLTVADAKGLADPTPATRVVTVTPPSGVIPQNDWSLVYVDSEELIGQDGAATNAFDNDTTTFWHTEWYSRNPAHPHEIQIDLGAAYYVDGFRYLSRQDGEVNGRISQYEFYVSDSTSLWGTAVASGTLPNSAAQQEVRSTAKTGRYIRLLALSEVDGNPWTSMAEIDILGFQVAGGDPVLSSIAVTPAIVNLSPYEVQSFNATGFDQYGEPIAAAFTWSVNGGGTIDNQGFFSATSIGGPFAVAAQSAAITGTASVAISDIPGNEWQTATPDSQGVGAAVLNTAMNYFDANAGGVDSDEMVIVRNGRIIWQGSQTDAFHSIVSGTKVFTTTILGLLVQDGTIPSVESHAVDFLPSLDDEYPDYAAMTFKQMASFTSGYDADTIPTPDMIWGDATHFLDPISPSAYPGTRWEYSDPTSFQLGNLLTIASGDTLENIFATRIADNIGMTDWEWRNYGLSDDGRGQDIVAYFTNPSGIYGGGIAATPLDIARFGLLFLNRGKWAGQQLLASSWVDAATTNQVSTSLSTNPNFDLRGRYGFGWLTNGIAADGNRPWPSAPLKTYTFYGGARNFCFVVPEWNMVIARMSPADQSEMPFDTVWEGFFSRLNSGISDTPNQQVPQKVTGFTLINADTNSVIGPLENGSVIDIGMYPRINIRANTFPTVVGSVQFDADGNAGFHTTSIAPYYLMEDNTGNTSAWSPSIGSHVITATPYSSAGATGTEGNQLSVSFSVIGTIGGPILPGTSDAWQTVVLSFDGPPSAEDSDNPNPFLDYRMQVVFSGPSGQIYDVPGYFDGNGDGDGSGNVWKVRFVPDEEGTWSFLASFRQGPSVAISNDIEDGISASFNGKSGTFTVSPRDPYAPGFLSKGRLVYGNNYHLKTLGDGLYWIKGGTDEPENFLAYQGFDATTGRPDYPEWLHDYDAHMQHWSTGDPDWGSQDGRGIVGAINYLASKQVNSIYLLLMNIGGDGQDVWPYAGTIDRAGATANDDNLHFDISKLHQWDIVFDHAQKRGINLNLVLSEGESANKRELDNAGLGTERKLYYREMIARFSNHNALEWMLCEEYDSNDLPIAPAMIKSWAQYIRDVDPYDHPVSVHNMAQDAWDPFFGDPRFDTTSYQFAGLGSNYRTKTQSLRDQAAASGRPIAIAIDEPVTATTTDDEAHVIMDHGDWQQHAFGQSFMRKDVIYPIYFSGGSVELILQTGLSTDDFSQYDKLWDYMYFARKLLEDLPFWEMEPSDSLLSGESSSYSGGQVFSKNSEIYAIYLPSATPSGNLDLRGITGDFQRRWYNPRTGLFEGAETVVAGGSMLSLGTPPSDPSEDWVVLLEKETP